MVRNIESSLGVTAQRSGSATTFFLRDPNGTILSSRTGSTRVNYVSEASGHVVWLVAPDGTQVGGYKYAPYGKTAAYGSAAQTNRFRWLGAQQNISSSGTDGHYKLGARYYDLQGHFTQPDPLSGGMSDPRTLTGYNYAGGDPINQADINGRFFDELTQAYKGFGALTDSFDVFAIGKAFIQGDFKEGGIRLGAFAVTSLATTACGAGIAASGAVSGGAGGLAVAAGCGTAGGYLGHLHEGQLRSQTS
ncbi:RHS repeat-associated protein [Aeromicrobium sp. SORGH_AS981]|uniref:RHS repeat-associated core domain-containing protein n=1 Tax=Aeromicrobium sp. SORGH_AS_0981 TaxID=3041802 RepID=UPI002865E51A|nr:RHS repeat-associated core domain-containing protein [Aeromicrobium sp. SORGH_AS_0981]MDR6118252.1 RHS repeat-associated protein [Aeromicrobium sp. SORGH_AS_0981]